MGVALVATVAVAAVLEPPDTMPADAPADSQTAAASSGPPSDAGEPEVWPVEFRHPTGLTMLFDDGVEDGVAVDLDTGEQASVPLPQRAGDQPYRIWRLGTDQVVVGWGEIHAVAFAPDAVRQLPDATIFVPAAEPDQLWLVDSPEGRVDRSGDLTATLVDGTGEVLASIATSAGPAGAEVLRGVPGGLALRTDDGELVVAGFDGTLHRNYLGESAAHLLDVNGTHVLWCRDPCDALHVTDGARALDAGADLRISDGGAGPVEGARSFDTSAAWLSPDNTSIVAVAMVEASGGGVDREMRVHDRASGSITTRATIPLGEVRAAWSPDGRQLVFTISAEPATAGPQLLGGWRVGGPIRTFDVRPHLQGLGQFTVLATEDAPSVP